MRLIDADAFEAELNERLLPELIKRYGRDEALRGLHFSFRDCICNIQMQPTIEPERKKGRWIFYESENDRYDDIKCPFCKKSYTVDAYRIDDIGFTAGDLKFCPNCGARMEGEG